MSTEVRPQPRSIAESASDDDVLMTELQDGNRAAFQTLVDRYQGPLLGFFLRNTGDRHLSEDLTQETLLRIYDQSWNYLPGGRFRGWMYRIARNLLIDDVRRRSHDALVRANLGAGPEDEAPLARLTGEVLTPMQHADQRELAAIVDQLLAELPDDQRLTFTLHHYAALALSDVAEITEVPLPTCKSRLRLAREKLRTQLTRRGFRPPSVPREATLS